MRVSVMHPSASTTSILTFVLRFQREVTTGGTRWRGSIEYVQSGEKAVFLELEAMLAFLRRFGIKMGERYHL
jgi:hypothetical protein